MNWSILGIDETKDKKVITKAYRDKLSLFNPEEKPAEFMALREAYDTALKLADIDASDEPSNEYEGFAKNLEAIYNSFQRRIDVSEWKNLLKSDISTGLDSRPEIEDILISFLLDHYKLPKRIWEYLNEEFEFLERVSELSEKYPKDFVKYVIVNGCTYNESVPYDLFYPGKDGAEIDRYLQAFAKRREIPFADAAELVDELSKFSEKHPYGDFYISQYYVSKGQMECLKDLDRLYQEYPDNSYILDNYAFSLFMINDLDKAFEVCQKALSLEPDNYEISLLLADIIAKRGKYLEANDILTDLTYKVNGNHYILHEITEKKKAFSDRLIEHYEKELHEHSDSVLLKLELGWAYIDKNDFETAKKVTSDIIDTNLEGYCEFSYSNINACIAVEEKDYEKALIFIDRVLVAIDNLNPDGTYETDRALTRKNEFLLRKAGCYFETGQRKEAIELCRQVIKDDDRNVDAYKQIIVLLLAENLYSEAYEYAKIYVDLQPFSPTSHYYMARCAKEVQDYRLAFDEINEAINYGKTNLEFYLLECRILLKTGNYDLIKDILKFLKDNDTMGNLEIRYIEAQILRYHNDKQGMSLTEYKVIEKQIKPGRDCLWIADFYYEFGTLIADLQSEQNEFGYKKIISLMDKAYALDSRKIASREYKAWALYRLGRHEEALELYLELYKLSSHPMSITWTIAEIYGGSRYKEYEKALGYYLEIYESHKDDLEVLEKLGSMSFRLEDFEQAFNYYNICYDLSEGNVYFLRMCKMALLALSKYDEALKLIDEAIPEAKYTGTNLSDLYLMKVAILARLGRTDEALSILEDNATNNSPLIERAHKLHLRFCHYDKIKAIIKSKEASYNVKCHYYFLRGSKIKYILSMFKWLLITNNIYELNNKDLACDNYDKMVQLRHFNHRSNGKMLRAGKSLQRFYNSNLGFEKKTIYSSLLIVEDYYLSNKHKEAKIMATDLLKQFEKYDGNQVEIEGMRCTYSAYVTLYSILGDEEKAKTYLDSMQRKPRCNNCSFCICIDEAIARMFYLLSFGSKEDAYECIIKASDSMPGDLVLTAYRRWFKKKRIVKPLKD